MYFVRIVTRLRLFGFVVNRHHPLVARLCNCTLTAGGRREG